MIRDNSMSLRSNFEMNRDKSTSFRTNKRIETPVICNTLGPGKDKTSNIVRTDFTDKRFICGKYRPSETCKKDFYAGQGDGVEWTRRMFEELRLNMSHMKFNVLLTFSNELLVQFTIDLYQFSKQKYEDLNHYMNTS